MHADRFGLYLLSLSFSKVTNFVLLPAHKAQPAEKDFEPWFENHVKDTFEDELADTMIRLLDLCGAMDIDLEWHISQKLKYNRTRVLKHDKGY